MKAIVYEKYGPPETLHIRELDKPNPRDNEILIKVRAAAVTTVDCIFRRGDQFMARLYTGLTKPKNMILGTEMAGEIEAIGRNVKKFKVGEAVFGSLANLGAYAEYICVSEDEALSLIPANLSCEDAASISEGTLTALPFLRDTGQIQSGQEILINGASGSVGTAALQLGKHLGAKVTGVCSTANIDHVKSLGADAVIDYTKTDFTQTGQTYDIIFDTIGKSTFSLCKPALKPNGVYLCPVISSGILFQMAWTSMVGRKKAKFTATGARPAKERAKDLQLIKELIENEQLKPVIDRRFPLAQIVEAHRYVERGHKKGNVVITMNPTL